MTINGTALSRSARGLIGWACLAMTLSSPHASASEDSTQQKHHYEARLATLQSIQSALSGSTSRETQQRADNCVRDAAAMAAVEEYEIAVAILDDGTALLKGAFAGLKNASGQAGATYPEKPGDSDRQGMAHHERAHVARDIEYTRSLIDALRRERAVSPEEIASLEQNIDATKKLLESGKTRAADLLIDGAYLTAKRRLAELQKPSRDETGSAALANAAARSETAKRDTQTLRSRFSVREESVKSLQTAFDQIAKGNPQHQSLGKAVGQIVTEARLLASKDDYPAALTALDRAYLMLKTGIGDLRGGQELTVSKSFATPAEEYRYEQGVNDDYAQLIGGLIERTPRPDWVEIAQRSKDRRTHAEAATQRGDWQNALKQIDQSTNELKKILRSAGFPTS